LLITNQVRTVKATRLVLASDVFVQVSTVAILKGKRRVKSEGTVGATG
jgi:hypothetical protein